MIYVQPPAAARVRADFGLRARLMPPHQVYATPVYVDCGSQGWFFRLYPGRFPQDRVRAFQPVDCAADGWRRFYKLNTMAEYVSVVDADPNLGRPVGELVRSGVELLVRFDFGTASFLPPPLFAALHQIAKENPEKELAYLNREKIFILVTKDQDLSDCRQYLTLPSPDANTTGFLVPAYPGADDLMQLMSERAISRRPAVLPVYVAAREGRPPVVSPPRNVPLPPTAILDGRAGDIDTRQVVGVTFGPGHALNDDAILYDEELGILLLASGRGAPDHVWQASAEAVRSIYGEYLFTSQMHGAFVQADLQMESRSREFGLSNKSYSACVDMVIISGNTALFGHVGSGRIYHFNGGVDLCTVDHTKEMCDLLESGQVDTDFSGDNLREVEARVRARKTAPQDRYDLYNVLGSAIRIDVDEIDLRTGDWLFMCSEDMQFEFGNDLLIRLADLRRRGGSIMDAQRIISQLPVVNNRSMSFLLYVHR
ncbi:MAG: hypothetical protein WC901_03600 [Candidatus Margulisiibacteriota bacterium]